MSPKWILAFAMTLAFTATSQAQRDRFFMETDFLEIGRVTDPRGKWLAKPQRLTRCGGVLGVLDSGDTHVTGVSLENRILWRAGRSGSGPGEFRTVESLDCGPGGDVWVPDRGNARIQVISSNGTLLRTIPMEKGIRRLVHALDDSTLWANTIGSSELVLMLDRQARIVRTFDLPPWLRRLTSQQLESFLAPTKDGALIVAFRWSSMLLKVGAGGTVDSIQRGIEPIPFPEMRAFPSGRHGERVLRIDPAAPEAVQGLSINGDTINVLFAGRSGSRGRIIDKYLTSGRYVGSVQLPVAPLDIVVAGDRIYALLNDPEPAVITLIKRPRRARP
jgi:hypothetical protein